ncbi:MAG TPA: DnaB-like helicase C-terminal domain-containing protein [Clostridia bacterium]|nr:DnaB-like helicase C-terminal domain-containing protein [Clostridia bacterium]
MRHERDRARDEIKARLPEYLEGKGLPLKKPFKCLNPGHQDNNPSMSYDQDRNKVHCFSCGADYDRIDLIGIDYGLEDYNEKLKKGCDLYGIRLEERDQNMDKKEAHHGRSDRLQTNKVTTTENNNLVVTKDSTGPEEEKDLTALFDKWHSQLDQTDYLRNRGISPEVADKFNVGYCQDWRHPKTPEGPASPRLIIPTSKGTYTARAINDNDPRRYMNAYGNPPMNLEALNGDRPVYIVEGEIDALSIVEAGGEAIGLGSVANHGKLPGLVKGAKMNKALILALDNDKAGQEATEVLARGLHDEGIPFHRYNPYGDHKDANAALLADRETFKRAIKEGEALEEKEYRAAFSAAGHMQAFEDMVKASGEREELSTGWKGLDLHMDGGLNPELIILGAITGLGKTTLAIQMADQIAMQGKDVLYFSLEMGRHELIARSISRETITIGIENGYPKKYWKSSRGISKGKRYQNYDEVENELIGRAKERYRGYAQHIFYHEGLRDTAVDDIQTAVDEHERITGKPPAAVFVDYLQILKPPSKLLARNPTTKDITDDAIWTLKAISRSKGIPVIAVSSLSRENYKGKQKKINLAHFKESGAIEYSSDVLLALDFTRTEEDDFNLKKAFEREPREIDLGFLKNRNGPRLEPIQFYYHSTFNLFQDEDMKQRMDEESEKHK